jgi:kynurenine formamidase
MAFATDPKNGLQFVELSHPWGTGVPSYPGDDDVIFDHGVKHAQFGVQAFKIRTNFHTGTHMIAPIHMKDRGDDLAQVDPGRFFGNGIILTCAARRTGTRSRRTT